jgi:PIN domain nuclease of toxin-antitoxin system
VERGEKSVIFLDTHIVVWLYAGKIDKLSKPAKKAINKHQVMISPIVELELQYLYEIGRIKRKPQIIVAALGQSIGLKTSDDKLTNTVKVASQLGWTRDPFDRLIVASATIHGANLISADKNILKNYSLALW